MAKAPRRDDQNHTLGFRPDVLPGAAIKPWAEVSAQIKEVFGIEKPKGSLKNRRKLTHALVRTFQRGRLTVRKHIDIQRQTESTREQVVGILCCLKGHDPFNADPRTLQWRTPTPQGPSFGGPKNSRPNVEDVQNHRNISASHCHSGTTVILQKEKTRVSCINVAPGAF